MLSVRRNKELFVCVNRGANGLNCSMHGNNMLWGMLRERNDSHMRVAVFSLESESDERIDN